MEVVKLKGATKSYIWGGNKLFNYGKNSDSGIIAESWELSCHKDGPSIVDSGANKGKLLCDLINEEIAGKNCSKFPFFPILNKLIDAKNDLSIQVHPSDDYALKYENSFGKTEMWYVVEAEEGAMLHIGFNKDVSKEEVEQRIQNNTLLDVMNHIPVKKGDCYFIPSGTLHAIGKGCLIYEIQENSNITYRVYDYGRVGADGKPRELHVEKALKVINFDKTEPKNLKGPILAKCEYFTVTTLNNPSLIQTDDESFALLTVIEGNGKIDNLNFAKGDSFFVPSNKKVNLTGDCFIIETRV